MAMMGENVMAEITDTGRMSQFPEAILPRLIKTLSPGGTNFEGSRCTNGKIGGHKFHNETVEGKAGTESLSQRVPCVWIGGFVRNGTVGNTSSKALQTASGAPIFLAILLECAQEICLILHTVV